MAVIKELIRKEGNGSISFGNYNLDKKTKISDFEVQGDMYKVKTWNEITKLERNGTFVYESIPGTAVKVFEENDKNVNFFVEGKGQTQITLELEAEKSYRVIIEGRDLGISKTDIGGKITFDVDLTPEELAQVEITAE